MLKLNFYLKNSLLIALAVACAGQDYKDYLATKQPAKVKNVNFCLTELDPAAKSVELMTLPTQAKQLKRCEFIINVETDYCSHPDWIHPGSLNHLKNQVALHGGDTLVLEVPLTANKYQRILGQVYHCRTR